MQVPRRALNGRHLGTAQCLKGQRPEEKETRENLEQAFEAYGRQSKAYRNSNTWGEP